MQNQSIWPAVVWLALVTALTIAVPPAFLFNIFLAAWIVGRWQTESAIDEAAKNTRDVEKNTRNH